MSDGITEARRGTYFNNSTSRVNKPEQEKPPKLSIRNWFLRYGHWSFFVLSIAEALVGDGLTATALMILFYNYQIDNK